MNTELMKKANNIKLFITDVDGVLTDGRILLGSGGQEFKAFHARDGMGIKMAQDKGIKVAIITGRKSDIVDKRAEELEIKDVFQGIKDKLTILKNLINSYNIDYDQTAYIGDDLNDLPVLKKVGLSISVADGAQKVKDAVDFVTEKRGGKGAVREAVEFIIMSQEKERVGGDMFDPGGN